MRLAIIAPLALAAVVGLSTAAAACPVDTVTGPITELLNTVTNVLGLTTPTTPTTTEVVSTVEGTCGSTPTGSNGPTGPTTSGTCSKAKSLLTGGAPSPLNGSVTNNFITNNFITNNTTTTTAADGTTPAATGTTTAATGPLALTAGTGGGGGGVGGGGGGFGGGGFGGGSTGISGMPINPSSDFAAIVMPMSTGGGIGGTTFNALAAGGGGGGQTSDVSFAMASPGTDGPLTAGVALASLPAGQAGDEAFVGMASPKTGPGTSVAAASPFGFEAPTGAADGPPPGAGYGGLMLAGLVGVGVLGAGWAWKSLVV